MTTATIREIARQLNGRAAEYEIGNLQDRRMELKGLKSLPGNDIFRIGSEATQEDWAFHSGGRKELQFNIGFEREAGVKEFRHGVAFSLEPSQTLPEIDPLLPKIRLFNDFLRENPNAYQDMGIWYFEDGLRSDDHSSMPIPPEWVRTGVFIFFGKKRPVDEIDYEDILTDFDRLLPLYEYVESQGETKPLTERAKAGFEFRPGHTPKPSSTVATPQQRQVDIALRHNELQEALHARLVSEVGADNVGTENLSGGKRVDVVVQRGEDRLWFYEIKTALTACGCIREALGQLLEYSFYPGGKQAERLVVVGEAELDDDSAEYLRGLNERFGLSLSYEQIDLPR